jgi:phage terminase large subunit GpA-like protein
VRDGGEVFRLAFLDGLRPDAQLLVSEWADRFRMLSQKSSNEYGPYRTSRTPYMREIMDSLSDTSPVEQVVFVAGSQVGKSEGGYNWVGYSIDHAPAPMLIVVPRKEDAQKVSRQRIDPMIEGSPRLRGKVREARSRDSGNSTYLKEFPGGVIALVGANSAAGLRAMPAKKLFLDEIDEFPGDVGGEGDPIQLAIRRTGTYRTNRKIYMVSSPTLEGRSRIMAEYEQTDRRVFLVPCPECGAFQQIGFRTHLRWTEGDPSTVYMECEACHAHVTEGHKTKMLDAGFWMARRPEAPARVRGYLLSALYSPVGWYSWQMAVEDFLKAKKSQALLKVFVNTVLAETFVVKGEAPEWDRLYERREPYGFSTVPRGGLMLTMGIDIQADRLELEVVAWGRGLESWSVEYLVLPGKPEEAQVWLDLSREIQRTFTHESGVQMSVRAIGLDTGYATQHAYRWVRTQPISRVFAMKGTDDQSALVSPPKAVEVQHQGRRLARGIKLWQVGGPVAKSELYSFLRLPKPTDESGEPFPAGYCHFPEYSAEHFKRLTAEEVVPTTTKQGYRRWVWTKVYERNEQLDCRVLARAAAAIVGIDRFTDAVWDELGANLGAGAARAAPAVRPKRTPKSDGGGGYLNRWQSPRT